MKSNYTYLLINFLTVFFPLILSFDKRVQYFKSWRYLFPSLLLVGLLYLIWDIIFTYYNVWSFNTEYIVNIKLYGLPLEEILFFFTVPFSCIFIYECVGYYVNCNFLYKAVPILNLLLLSLSCFLFIINFDKIYSMVNFATLFFLMCFIQIKKPVYMPKFYLAYAISLLPFYIVNGYLTALPVVEYNSYENMEFRIGTIPFEDHFYSLSLMLLNVVFFEYFRKKHERIV